MSYLNYVIKWFIIGTGALWCYVEPTIPYAFVCLLAVILDCISAVRLNRRVKKQYPDGGADGKFKSQHAIKMISDIAMVYGCILLASLVDEYLLAHIELHLGNYVAAIFCFVELWSVLENESSCNGSKWAKLLQRFMVDKTKRHLNLDVSKDDGQADD